MNVIDVVADFGAPSDGASDARPAIELAMQAASNAPGSEVHFPVGTYLVTLAPHPFVSWWNVGIAVPARTTVSGCGPDTKIRLAPDQPEGIGITNRDPRAEHGPGYDNNIVLRDFLYDGLARHQTELQHGIELFRCTTSRFLRMAAINVHGDGAGPTSGERFSLHASMCDNVTFEDCWAWSGPADDAATGIAASGSTNITVRGGCVREMNHGAAYAFWQCTNLHIDGVRGQRSRNGINLEYCRDVAVTGCTFGGATSPSEVYNPVHPPNESLGNSHVGIAMIQSQRVTFAGCTSRLNGTNYQLGGSTEVERHGTFGF